MKNKLCMGLLTVASGAYLLRRLGLRWGATDAEVHRPLPGDEVMPHPMIETTHAITIRAPRAAIWPWLVQMGYHRAAWYTDSWYYWVDKYLFRLERPPSADRILPQFQHLEVGDTVPDGPRGQASSRLQRSSLSGHSSSTPRHTCLTLRRVPCGTTRRRASPVASVGHSSWMKWMKAPRG